MGISVGYLPGPSVRPIADLTPAGAKDAPVITGATRMKTRTLRAITGSHEDGAVPSMLADLGPDLAREVRSGPTAASRAGRSPRPRPVLEAVLGPGRAHDAVVESRWAYPFRAEQDRQGPTDARLNAHGCGRHATWTGQIISAQEHQSATVAGTDTAGTVLAHLTRQLIAP